MICIILLKPGVYNKKLPVFKKKSKKSKKILKNPLTNEFICGILYTPSGENKENKRTARQTLKNKIPAEVAELADAHV